jgi:biopolymer transport protein ExbB/TolQ
MQIDAFLLDIRDVIMDARRSVDRATCWSRMKILDEQRPYLDSPRFETISNMARTMIEAYPLAGVLGTILAIGAALQTSDSAGTAAEMAATLSGIVARFGDAIWSTFFGLVAAILLMFVHSLLEPRFARLLEIRREVREVVALAKRELAATVPDTKAESS